MARFFALPGPWTAIGWSRWAWIPCAWCLACADGPEPRDPPGDPARVVLGTGMSVFQPLEGEPTVTLVRGFQGGFHVWTSFLAYGFESDVVHMDLSTSWDGSAESTIEMSGNIGVKRVVDAAGEDALGSVGWPAVIYNPTCAHGQRLRIDLSLSDSAGRRASDTRHCIADVPEGDRASDCETAR